MKKNILFLIFLLLSTNSFCQQKIQNKFWGYFFGINKVVVKSGLDREGTYFKETPNSLSFYDKNFGGCTWEYIDLYFYKNEFYEINFTTHYKKDVDASNNYDYFKSVLEEKYKNLSLREIKDNNSKRIFFSDEYNTCMLELLYSESKGGEMYWYLRISYWNQSLSEKYSKSINDEL